MSKLQLHQGDITGARVDAIVNAANPQMLGGGGVDGAIHLAAGPELLKACYEVPADGDVRCPIGDARITRAGDLRARYVIHTVGPRYTIDPDPPALLKSAYRNSLQLALEYHCKSIALPAVSCGVYGYPLNAAARIAIDVCRATEFNSLSINFYLFGQEIFEIFTRTLKEKPA